MVLGQRATRNAPQKAAPTAVMQSMTMPLPPLQRTKSTKMVMLPLKGWYSRRTRDAPQKPNVPTAVMQTMPTDTPCDSFASSNVSLPANSTVQSKTIVVTLNDQGTADFLPINDGLSKRRQSAGKISLDSWSQDGGVAPSVQYVDCAHNSAKVGLQWNYLDGNGKHAGVVPEKQQQHKRRHSFDRMQNAAADAASKLQAWTHASKYSLYDQAEATRPITPRGEGILYTDTVASTTPDQHRSPLQGAVTNAGDQGLSP